ncbi:MAG: endopeptidase La [Candidatus Omnitrophota bacterium]
MDDNKDMKSEKNDPSDKKEMPSMALIKDLLPDVLPVVPLFDRPAFPRMMKPLTVDNPEMIKIIIDTLEKELPLYLALVYIHPPEPEGTISPKHIQKQNLYGVGVTAKVVQISPPRDMESLQVLIQVMERFDIVDIVKEEPVLHIRVKYWPETVFENNEELKAYSVAIIENIKELVKLNPLFKEGLTLVIERINVNDPGALCDFAASMTTASGEELQKILEIKNIRTRIEEVLIILKREVEISTLKIQISKRIEERLSKQQREFFLKQQLKEIKKELGLAKDDAETELEKFQKRIAKLTLSDEAKKRIDEEMDKMRLLEPSSPEFNVSRNYLEWLTVLPWGVYTKDNYDLKHAANVLDEDHYGLSDVKDRILEFISVGIIKGNLAGSIILLVGPPGVGKTSIGQSVARSLGRQFYRFSLGGMRDEAEIKGHRRTYIGALPGKFLQAIKTCNTANPVIMLDEIDKIGASFHGDPASALLEVLDPEQNKDFLDHYLDVRFDLSKVLFICTANQVETIPAPLLDRMELIRLSGYILEEKMEIALHYLIPKQLKAHGLEPKQVIIPDNVLHEMIDGYSREAGVRGLENNIKKILRKSVKTIVEDKIPSIKIKSKDLPKLLGRRMFTEDKVFRKPKVGVVMGLAYTTLGGATLFVEATPVPSDSPGFKHTGQLGQVMIESSEIAYTYVRSLFRENEEVKEFFKKNLIHLHVPAGATPKDGPSAGITMACSIYSLVLNRPIIEDMAMTGELTLSGQVMPIGGVKEKVIATTRAKVSHVILPAENQEDFERLDDEIRKKVTPHFVETFEDVIKICFPDSLPKKR